MQAEPFTTSWIDSLRGCVSEWFVSNTGRPQGTVLSPFLFTLFTSGFQSTVDCFVKRRGNNHLTLNVAKTKEIVVVFRRNRISTNIFQ